MPARIITIANQKGGAGKTTIAMSIAGALALRSTKVLVVDADAQGTATQWAGSAPEAKPFIATVISLAHANGKLHQMIKPMVSDYDYIIIDCPPSVNEQASQSALLVSELCLVPLQPTPADMWATVGIFELVKKARTINPDLKAFAVANRVNSSNLNRQVMGVMEDNEIELLKSRLGNRTSFQESTIRGTTPHHLGAAHKVAAAEIDALVIEVFEKMGWEL
ncbi:MAG: ParA family partition ATPase [Deltaproteobacteria bacterium]